MGVVIRWWDWREIVSVSQLTWLPCDYELVDAAGVECCAVGDIAAPPLGWIRTDTGEPYIPQLPARVSE